MSCVLERHEPIQRNSSQLELLQSLYSRERPVRSIVFIVISLVGIGMWNYVWWHDHTRFALEDSIVIAFTMLAVLLVCALWQAWHIRHDGPIAESRLAVTNGDIVTIYLDAKNQRTLPLRGVTSVSFKKREQGHVPIVLRGPEYPQGARVFLELSDEDSDRLERCLNEHL